jgi:hypothetical protein
MEHLLQTAEAIRRDGKPEWMQVGGYLITSAFLFTNRPTLLFAPG